MLSLIEFMADVFAVLTGTSFTIDQLCLEAWEKDYSMKQSHKTIIHFSLLVVFVGLVCPFGQCKDNFSSLFNGKNLKGWRSIGTDKAFEVKNQSIYTTGAVPYPSWLRSEKEYENFVLSFEYKTEGWYEGGVFIHAPEHGPASKMGLKFHITHDQKKYGARTSGAIYDAATPQSVANKPSGEWNQCELMCDWPTLKVTLNGVLIHDINMEQDEAFRYRLRKGYIGIQNTGCNAYFRKFVIKELPNKEKRTYLFNTGLSELIPYKETEWEIKNGTLIGKEYDGFISTKEKFNEPVELQVWVKTMVNGNGGVHFNWNGEGPGIEVQVFNSPDVTNPTGSFYNIAPATRIASKDEEWFFMQIFSDGPHAKVIVNGEKVCETDQIPPPYGGRFAFQQHTPGATIYYKDACVIEREWR